MRKDRLNPVIFFDDGVFNKADATRTAKGAFSRNMAFYILGSLNYIEITPETKRVLYDSGNGRAGLYRQAGITRNLDEWIDEF